MLEAADFIAVNKFEKPRSEDALRDVRKQYRRNKNLFANHPGSPSDSELPIFGTTASKFNDVGVNALFKDLVHSISFKASSDLEKIPSDRAPEKKQSVIPASRVNYLRDISDTVRKYNEKASEAVVKLQQFESLRAASQLISDSKEIELKKKSLEAELVNELKEGRI